MLKIIFLILFLVMNLRVTLLADEVAKHDMATMPSLVT